MFFVTKRAESNLSTESSVYIWLHNYLINPLLPVYLELLNKTNSICVRILHSSKGRQATWWFSRSARWQERKKNTSLEKIKNDEFQILCSLLKNQGGLDGRGKRHLLGKQTKIHGTCLKSGQATWEKFMQMRGILVLNKLKQIKYQGVD